MMLGKNDAGQKLCRTDINHYVGQTLIIMQDRIDAGQKLCWTEIMLDKNDVGQN